MKRTFRFLTALAVAAACSASLYAQMAGPELQFDAADILQMPAGQYLGEVAGVATNSKGHIFVYTRTGHAYATIGDSRTFYHGGSKLFEFDQNGKFVREIGNGLYGMNAAQQVRIDPQDNIWIVDVGSSQVMKFDPDGRAVTMVFGRKPEAINVRAGAPGGGAGGPGAGAAGRGGAGAPGARGAAPEAAGRGGRGGGAGAQGGAPQAGGPGGPGGAAALGRGGRGAPGAGAQGAGLSRPADIAFDRQGNVYIADGLANNSRISKQDKDGHFVKSWGQTGTEPGQFNKPHGIAIDNAGLVYVADSGNKRIQVFDADGNFKRQFANVGVPQAMCITPGQHQYLYISNSNDPETLDNGEIYKVELDGTIVGHFGRAGHMPKEFGMTNALDCRGENELLVGEMTNWRMQKITLRK
jgi:DNA-binding beta-propeller fold protein YncE